MHALDFWLAITRYILTSKIPSNFSHPRYEREGYQRGQPHSRNASVFAFLSVMHIKRLERHLRVATRPFSFRVAQGCVECVCNVESHVLLPNQDQLFPSLIYLVYTSFLVYFRKSCFLPLFSATSSSFCPRYTPLFPPPTSVRYPAFAR